MADGQRRRVGARAHVLGHLELAFARDHLVQERQPGDEADHRRHPRRARVRVDEALDVVEVVDPRRVLEVGGVGVLVAVAEPHQRLVRPRVVVEHRDLDDARLELEVVRVADLRLDLAQQRLEAIGRERVGVEADLVGGVGRADVEHALPGGARAAPVTMAIDRK